MKAPVLWIWDKDDQLLFEGQFKDSKIMKTGEAYRYKHLVKEGTKEGRILTAEMVDMAIILDIAWLEKDGTLNFIFENEEDDKPKRRKFGLPHNYSRFLGKGR